MTFLAVNATRLNNRRSNFLTTKKDYLQKHKTYDLALKDMPTFWQALLAIDYRKPAVLKPVQSAAKSANPQRPRRIKAQALNEVARQPVRLLELRSHLARV